MRKSLGNTLCAGLVALGMTTSAHAVGPQFEASMNWSGFAVTLSDLDLSDGVTPTLQWTSQTTGASILMNGTLSSAAPAADFTSNVSIDDGFRFAGGDGTTLATTGSGLDGTLSFLEINAARYGTFTLSPMTKVDFTVPVTASAVGVPPGISFLGSLFLSANFTSFDSAGLARARRSVEGR